MCVVATTTPSLEQERGVFDQEAAERQRRGLIHNHCPPPILRLSFQNKTPKISANKFLYGLKPEFYSCADDTQAWLLQFSFSVV